MVNKVTLIGNLGHDPELRSTGGGSSVTSLRIATSERRKDRDGNWTDHTEWHTVVCFGRMAESVANYCKKGRQLYIEGRLQTRQWEDREGNTRYSTEVVAMEVKFLGGRDGGEGQSASQGDRGPRGGNSRAREGRPRGGSSRGSGGGSYAHQSREQEEVPYSDTDVPF